jgi:hypothetical protein
MVRFVVLLMTILSGCAYGSYISDSSNDYNVTVEDATVNDLVANILRARDGAPLYFSDLSQIRGSLTISAAAQATFPFGPIKSPRLIPLSQVDQYLGLAG